MKECGLDLLLVERELETEVETYECARGHRTEHLFAEVVKRTCTSFVDGKECGLPLVWCSENWKPRQKYTNARWITVLMCHSKRKKSILIIQSFKSLNRYFPYAAARIALIRDCASAPFSFMSEA